MYVSLGISYWLVLLLSPLAAGFFIRTFILMHDCAHGSFVPSRSANDIIGFVTGVLTLTPFAQWRRDHALHHASSGDLDRRGFGDIDTLTVDEYVSRSRWGRLKYRAFRHPLVLFGLGPLYLLVVQRIQTPHAAPSRQRAMSVHLTNLAIAALFLALSIAVGAKSVILVYAPAYYLAVASGIWLFYVQHQFEGAYWAPHAAWDYGAAALRGSSYYRLPRVLEWITGRIGLHHVHHFDPKIPNYHLRRAHESTDAFRQVPVLTLTASLRATSLKLWDDRRQRLVGFDAAKEIGKERP
jgi:omega-6 fatty acid desaturase (delta-12 desaturase)